MRYNAVIIRDQFEQTRYLVLLKFVCIDLPYNQVYGFF